MFIKERSSSRIIMKYELKSKRLINFISLIKSKRQYLRLTNFTIKYLDYLNLEKRQQLKLTNFTIRHLRSLNLDKILRDYMRLRQISINIKTFFICLNSNLALYHVS